jgi:hypothetical protein
MRWIDRHRGAIALTATVIVGLGVAGCGDNSTTTIITTAPAPGSGGVAPSTGSSSARTFVGTTSQGLQISFAVLADTVTSVQFGWRAKCDDGLVHTNTIALGSAPLQDGAFSVSGTLETGGYGQVDGKVTGDSASGTLSRSRGSAFNTNCVATGVTWSAHTVSP